MMSLSFAATIAPPLSICVRITSRLRLNRSTTFGGRLPKLMFVPPAHSRQYDVVRSITPCGPCLASHLCIPLSPPGGPGVGEPLVPRDQLGPGLGGDDHHVDRPLAVGRQVDVVGDRRVDRP